MSMLYDCALIFVTSWGLGSFLPIPGAWIRLYMGLFLIAIVMTIGNAFGHIPLIPLAWSTLIIAIIGIVREGIVSLHIHHRQDDILSTGIFIFVVLLAVAGLYLTPYAPSHPDEYRRWIVVVQSMMESGTIASPSLQNQSMIHATPGWTYLLAYPALILYGKSWSAAGAYGVPMAQLFIMCMAMSNLLARITRHHIWIAASIVLVMGLPLLIPSNLLVETPLNAAILFVILLSIMNAEESHPSDTIVFSIVLLGGLLFDSIFILFALSATLLTWKNGMSIKRRLMPIFIVVAMSILWFVRSSFMPVHPMMPSLVHPIVDSHSFIQHWFMTPSPASTLTFPWMSPVPIALMIGLITTLSLGIASWMLRTAHWRRNVLIVWGTVLLYFLVPRFDGWQAPTERYIGHAIVTMGGAALGWFLLVCRKKNGV